MKVMSHRKGAELALNVVVIAALAMLVLVVVGVIFLRGVSDVNPSETCLSKGGVCKAQCSPGEDTVRGDELCKSDDVSKRLQCCKTKLLSDN